jgi:hypothetical protein
MVAAASPLPLVPALRNVLAGGDRSLQSNLLVANRRFAIRKKTVLTREGETQSR